MEMRDVGQVTLITIETNKRMSTEQMTDVRGQMSEGRGQRSEVRGRRAEGRGQDTGLWMTLSRCRLADHQGVIYT